MKRLDIEQTPLQGLYRVRRQQLGDARGFFERIFCIDELRDADWRKPVAQVNHTYTVQAGAVRGLHFQRPPKAEMKLVSCVRGAVWDVAVDLRYGSPTFLQWHAERLDPHGAVALLIPEGFAHGYQTLSGDVELLYCHSEAHAPDAEAGLHPLEPRLAIAWPLPVQGLSTRDVGWPALDDTFEGVRV